MTYPCGCANELDERHGIVRSKVKCPEHQLFLVTHPSDGPEYFERMGAIANGVPQHKRYVAELEDALSDFGHLIPEAARLESGAKPGALEVGCGLGMYAPIFLKLGYEYRAIEKSLYAAAWTAGAFDVVVWPFEFTVRLAFADESQAVVMAAHVLEHVAEPVELLKETFRVLELGGIAYIVVPDSTDPTNPDHLTFFTIHSLTSLLDKVGFVSIQWASRPHPHENFYYVVARKP